MAEFEIGIVYKKGGNYFLAVSPNSLITVKDGDVTEIRPHKQYETARSMTVEALCDRWGIELEEFDRVAGNYLAPAQDDIKTRPRGMRRDKKNEDEIWRRVRTGRIARPRL